MLISIIIPIYNVEKYLNRCLDSVMKQSFQDIEIILVNDGSTDNSDNIIKSYLFDERIKYKIINTIKEKDLDILFTVNELFVIYEKYKYPVIKDVFYWIIYDWVSNAVSYKYPRIAIFNKKAISITRIITQDSRYKSVLLYCSTCHVIGFKRRILSWLQVRMFYVYYFLIGLLVRIKKLA